MKITLKNFPLLAVAVLLFSLSSCDSLVIPTPSPTPDKEEDKKPVEEEMAPEITVVDAQGSYALYPADTDITTEVFFKVDKLEESGQISLKADASVEAVLDETADGYAVTVSALETFKADARVTIVAQNDAKAKDEVVLTFQPAHLSVEREEVNASVSAADYAVAVNTNVDYTASADAEWVAVQISPKEALLMVSENRTGYAREAVVAFTDAHGVFCDSVTVKQSREAVTAAMEREALIAIYNALGGENWVNKSGWCSDKPLNEWAGVMTKKINGEDHVQYLHLQDHNAVGEIPPEIGNLEYITELWIIREPGITGELPETMRNLRRLKDLRIGETSITGEFPEFIKYLEEIIKVSLYDNLMTGNLPVWLAEIETLESFSFEGNCFDGEVDASLLQTKWWTVLTSDTHEPSGDCRIRNGQKYPHRLWKPGHEDDPPTYYENSEEDYKNNNPDGSFPSVGEPGAPGEEDDNNGNNENNGNTDNNEDEGNPDEGSEGQPEDNNDNNENNENNPEEGSEPIAPEPPAPAVLAVSPSSLIWEDDEYGYASAKTFALSDDTNVEASSMFISSDHSDVSYSWNSGAKTATVYWKTANRSTEERTAVLTFVSSESVTAAAVMVQKAAEPVITFTPATRSVEHNQAGSASAVHFYYDNINSNVAPEEITCTSSNTDELSVTWYPASLYAEAYWKDKNMSEDREKTAEITFSGGGARFVCEVRQGVRPHMVLAVTPSTQTWEAEEYGNEFHKLFTMTGNSNVPANTVSVTADNDDVHVEWDEPSGLAIAYWKSPNTSTAAVRTATLTFVSSEGVTATATMVQNKAAEI